MWTACRSRLMNLQSTAKDVPHRDMCVFFGYQDPAHLYYVHMAKAMDDHANQIFIVNDKPREKISTKTTEGTPWDDKWHHVRVVRTVADGGQSFYVCGDHRQTVPHLRKAAIDS